MVQSMLSSLVVLLNLSFLVRGTRVGDRHHGNTDTGLFYFFGQEITIVDPVSGEIVSTLEGAASWGDVVYMRDQAQIRHYAFANDREDNRMWVINCDTQEILSKVDTGDSPVHAYAIPSREEVWTHPDTNGTFDIVHMSDIEYLAHSNLKAHAFTPGHGKLLWDPNLQDQAFATNTQESYIYEIDLEGRELMGNVSMTLESAPYGCNRTHGIGYSWVNNHLYVECSHPGDCDSDDESMIQDGTICSGSTWEVDVETLEPVARLVSPVLDTRYGDSFGIQGQVYFTPDERYAVVTNKYQNYVHFLKPVNGADTKIVEVEVTGNPGKVEFWPKGEDVWGPDSELSDYFVIIGQEEQEDNTGIVMIDLADIYAAFEADEGEPDVDVIYIELGAGATYRPLARGADFAVTPSNGTSTYGGYTKISIVDLVEKELMWDLDIAGVSRILWVPDHNDEKVADHELRISILEESVAAAAAASTTSEDEGVATEGVESVYYGNTNAIETMAEAALAVAIVACFAAFIGLGVTVKNARHAKAVSGGEYKPFLCV